MARSATSSHLVAPAARRAAPPLLALMALLAVVVFPYAPSQSDAAGRSLPAAHGVSTAEPAAGREVDGRLPVLAQYRSAGFDRLFVPLATPPAAVAIGIVLLLALAIPASRPRVTPADRGTPSSRAPPGLAVIR